MVLRKRIIIRSHRQYLSKSRITGRGMKMMENREVKEQLGELFIALSKMIGAFALLAVSVAFGGYVTMYLWNGIVPPTFGVTALTWGQATGIDLLISFITTQRIPETKETLAQRFFYIFWANLIIMATGWVVMLFI